MDPEPLAEASSTGSGMRKRPGVASQSDGGGPPRIESSDIWLEDGNFIIETTSQEARTLYKVHKSTLALNTIFFRTLFSGSQDAFISGSEQYEGLHLMTMTDDADDVKEFLRALYFPQTLQQHLPVADMKPKLYKIPPSYHSILRVATKLECDAVRNSVIHILQLVWPCILSDWDVLQIGYNAHEGPIIIPNSPESVIPQIYPDPACIIQLAIDCNVPDLLPVAYYYLSCVYGWQPLEDAAVKIRTAKLQILDASSLIRLVEGKARLMGAFMDTLDDIEDHFNVYQDWPCIRIADDLSLQCLPALQTKIHEIRPGGTQALTSLCDPLECLREMVNAPVWHGDEICHPCRCQAKKILSLKRRELWMSLPKYFGLDDVLGPTSGWRQSPHV
ncbi:hypothetical protein OF83DRAFT_1176341 [Amylostereum chailletii]|nr:hypothetical protein OF83DRAFT_1176341 [Amylostereum chailletii]